jgi:putative transposase
MPDKYKNKYRISSARLQTWDYGYNGLYFVTICTKNREHYFCKIVDGQIIFSEIGEIARKYWHEIPEHFPFVNLDEFVVMPNHIHGIIIIDKPTNGQSNEYDDGRNVGTPNLGVPTDIVPTDIVPTDIVPTDIIPTNPATINPTIPTAHQTTAASKKWKPATLGVIINQYKRIVTIKSREINADFAWQPRFHDHIIRNNESFEKIRNYIIANPSKWKEDKFHHYN